MVSLCYCGVGAINGMLLYAAVSLSGVSNPRLSGSHYSTHVSACAKCRVLTYFYLHRMAQGRILKYLYLHTHSQ